ncbi:uncharacterized protein LOC132383602 isoform X4 [Hypanus sabinus]|uniref:uncharacterized protein LOC132383602 isoform X4 n=1 Tax=Hypanus sabinus TaxID=79690 RepID=UPI0028C4781E|nr:uncharacterized protein LOC132383602 isoform X4 [Hypanus sabinus]
MLIASQVITVNTKYTANAVVKATRTTHWRNSAGRAASVETSSQRFGPRPFIRTDERRGRGPIKKMLPELLCSFSILCVVLDFQHLQNLLCLKSATGTTQLAWLMSPGPVLLRKHS